MKEDLLNDINISLNNKKIEIKVPNELVGLDAVVRFYNTIGIEVAQSIKIEKLVNTTIDISNNISSLPTGVYISTFNTGNIIKSIKFNHIQ